MLENGTTNEHMAIISIVTVTYQAEKYLERTIRSIISQTSDAYQYIIVDGNSTDGTHEIVEKYKDYIDIFVSEPDNGLYDAMNKGLQHATGDFVWFMNAGDEIAESSVVQKIIECIDSNNADIVYGDTLYIDEGNHILGKRSELTPHNLLNTISWKDMKYGMLICHQSFIAKKAISSNYLLNNLSADIDWEINCLKKATNVRSIDCIVSKYLIGGISQKHHRRSLLDRYKILQKHFGVFQNILNHIFILYRAVRYRLK